MICRTSSSTNFRELSGEILYRSPPRTQRCCISVLVATVMLLLPDEMLEAIDATRDGPRLEWIRQALRHRLTMDQNQAENRRAVAAAQAAHGRAVTVAGPRRATRTVTRQGTLPGGDTCAHPFRDEQNRCRVCGQQR